MNDRGAQGQTVRLAEVVGCLSLATDLATGQPLEHALRRALLAVWLGEELGLASAELSDVYYVALPGTVGCAIEGTVFARFGTDDIALSAEVVTVDPSRPLEVAAFGLKNFGAGVAAAPGRKGRVGSACGHRRVSHGGAPGRPGGGRCA